MLAFTYDLNKGGVLIITANPEDIEGMSENDIIDELRIDSELEIVYPWECGDLTDAPMLGLRDDEGNVTARWAFMSYAVELFSDVLREHGKVVFVSE